MSRERKMILDDPYVVRAGDKLLTLEDCRGRDNNTHCQVAIRVHDPWVLVNLKNAVRTLCSQQAEWLEGIVRELRA